MKIRLKWFNNKKSDLGFLPFILGAASHTGDTQPQHTNISTMQGETHKVIQDLSPQPQVSNGVSEAIPESDNQYTLEATRLWSMAKQLGLTRGGSKEAIIQKFQQMEERDKVEANRRDDSNTNQ